ncbi:hypothetical protein SAMN05421805_103440 [Saccharopolyspora antimicrobica]|uniref:Uncharacterized protein n=2 Tax=Saccharopolyspora TaxID=1835 RepID=A0A1I4XIR4_9PSEU|nr:MULTISPECIES: hypothetical protein [Saccharopolyspora]RKT84508.1 hypothetical protein ATL45_2824 [Saccharopolyspora antimicrobica]SEG96123.1 hypothetical protein SAMN02982929_06311 [Saccharopolyspora kobensis]SFD22043.1 hypothetical protein SAMN05216506_103115 [Saccharopolyspora kobensis]SFN25120.1 hypothetical protein SAMN05421805_103440 [Saccharopolyspora antimicrobica]
MVHLAMLALSLIAVAAVFLALRTEDDESGEKSEAGEIDRIRRDQVAMAERASTP